jgi:uncharacterized membrane protein (UPF0127 family)
LSATLLLLVAAAGAISAEERSEYGNPFTWVTLGQVKVKAEAVQSPQKTYLGLSHRKELPEGRGMLFAMPAKELQRFCMRGMNFPLDFIWLVPGKVAGLAQNVPADFPGEICSPEPVSHVLEVPAGFIERYGIQVGDPAHW